MGRPTSARQPLTVLFVDPDTRRAEMLAEPLRALGYVMIVPTAHATMAALARHVPDLLILDLDLPDASGIALIAQIHGTKATHDVLFLVLSRQTDVRDKIAAFTAGADDYVVWPIDPEAFLLRVRLLSRFRRTLQKS